MPSIPGPEWARAFVVAFEGVDGVGKTTAVEGTLFELRREGFTAVAARAPDPESVGYKEIRQMLADGTAKTRPADFQELMVNNRLDWQANKLPTLLRESDFVLLDRWSWSTRAYGLAGGLSVEAVDEFVAPIYSPDLVLFLTGPQRRRKGEQQDSLERDTAFQDQVAQNFEILHALHEVFPHTPGAVGLATEPSIRIKTDALPDHVAMRAAYAILNVHPRQLTRRHGKTLREWQREIHSWAVRKGWWPMKVEERNVGELLALMTSEISEALEEWRRNRMDLYFSSSPSGEKPEGFGVELADAVIRICDTAEAYGIDLQELMERKMAYNEKRPFRHGGLKA